MTCNPSWPKIKQHLLSTATSTSGVAASILPGGWTAHSRFKMPIDINDNFRCNISKQSSLTRLIRDAKLIVWDEASMAKKNMIEALDALLRDIMDVDTMFGGKVILFGGDFRQTPPVVRNGKKEDFIHESLLYSEIWNKLEKLYLFENMRARTDPSFCEYLLRNGNGTERTNCEDKIEIPNSFVIPFTTEAESLDALFSVTYPDLHAFSPDSSMITSRVILTTKNDFVNEISNMLITKFP
ncbi:PREDICTED: ATP-dependent DNA helicase RRM3-like [Nicotiana attenuata]|uniref:ATP-dependent DNA helicase RRM3-like n=1 Tax=Nicotiana attenuata TaxID=49451 RepID=UPI0009047757|nr:PREDICTED: ATP-dependent DNA helicase RRM3-like [Nicotiana attenuata]